MYKTAPEINISSVPDIVSDSRYFVLVTRNSCRSPVYDMLLKFENLPVIVTGRKRILSVTHEIVPDSNQWLAVISCTWLGGKVTTHPHAINSSKYALIYRFCDGSY